MFSKGLFYDSLFEKKDFNFLCSFSFVKKRIIKIWFSLCTQRLISQAIQLRPRPRHSRITLKLKNLPMQMISTEFQIANLVSIELRIRFCQCDF